MMASGTNNTMLASIIDQKSQTVFCCLDWTTAGNLPFSWCEDPIVSKYTNLEHISTETLLKYAGLVVRQVEVYIGLALPSKFGIMSDGWTFQSEHYLTVFADFEHDGRADKVLLAFSPLIDDDVTDHSSASHVKYLEEIVPFYDRDIADVTYLVGDNCTINTKLADLLGIPLIGCASHRLHLAVQRFMADYDYLFGKIQDLMRKLRNLNHSTKLRKNTSLSRIAPNHALGLNTQDGKALFAIKDFVDTSDDELAELMPTRHEKNKLRAVQDDLRVFKSASKELQSDDNVTLQDVRDIFDALIERYPSVAQYLQADEPIVKSPAFEDACIKILLGKEAELSPEKHERLKPFAVPVADRSRDDTDDDDDRAGFTDRALRARKMQCVAAQA